MITSVTVRNFKFLKEATIPLGERIVLAGPNNSGKTTAIQALTMWQLALNRWREKRGDNPKSKAKMRTGVPITRRELTVAPTREMRLLWNDCNVMSAGNRKLLVEILVEGVTRGNDWKFGMELEYQGPEMLYCRPMRVAPKSDERMSIPEEVRDLTIVHLPPLAGLRREEEKLEEGSLNVRIGEGRAGDVIRNLLYNVAETGKPEDWGELKKRVADFFQVELLRPQFIPSTAEIVVQYRNGLPRPDGRNPHPKLDLANGGSGFHQVTLLLAFLYARSGSVLLLDEPDAHLEIIRQRDIYRLLTDLAAERDAQLIVATHSEVILDETPHDHIVAFLGSTPHMLISSQQKSQVRKSLSEIHSKDYLLAEQCGCVLYVEDYTDVDILREWAQVLGHRAVRFLSSPFAVYVGNVPAKAREHFFGLREAYPSLKGLLLIDRTNIGLHEKSDLVELMWDRQEIENYLIVPSAIQRFCEAELRKTRGLPEDSTGPDMFVDQELKEVPRLLKKYILRDVFTDPLKDIPFLRGTKMSEVVLDPFFRNFYGLIKEYNLMPKSKFYRLAAVMKQDEIHPDVRAKLDAIAELAARRDYDSNTA
ncbi:AAA family ATPase [bacterium]|nr:AAA family ATPase [bacterium]